MPRTYGKTGLNAATGNDLVNNPEWRMGKALSCFKNNGGQFATFNFLVLS